MIYDVYADSAANIPASVVEEYGIHIISFENLVNGKKITCFEPGLTEEEERAKGKEYYDAVRNGASVKTSLISIENFHDAFEPSLKEGHDVIYFSLSHGISGTYNSARLAIDTLKDEYPDRKIEAVDSLNASLAQGILALYACELRDQGVSIEEAAELLQDAAHGMNGIFTVEDLKYLVATGRVSNAKAFVASTLSIKPLLKGNSEGVIVQFKLARGRKKSLRMLADLVVDNIIEPEKQIIGIAHADAYEESLKVMEEIQSRVKVRRFINTSYDFCTGTHVGPGTIALFFIGSDRELDGSKEGTFARRLLEKI